MATKYLALEQLQRYHGKLKEAFVAREHKTGSEEEWKVLSDNNFTDEMKAQLEAEEGFEGTYESLTGKPTIDGHEVAATNTAESLGLAKAEDIPGVATTLAAGTVKPDGTTITVDIDGTIKVSELESYAKKTDLPGVATKENEGLVKPDGTTVDVTEEGVLSAKLPDVSDMLTKTEAAKEYLTQKGATDTYATKVELTDYAKSEKVASDISDAKDELNAAIKTAVTGVYTPKGSVTFSELPTPSAENVGWVYDVNETFVTDDKFAEQGQSYPKGTNVAVVDDGDDSYSFDVLSGQFDTSDFIKKTDVESISNDEIDALFAAA